MSVAWGAQPLFFPEELRLILVQAADGDARQALNLLEIIADAALDNQVTKELLTEVLQVNLRRFDKQGEAFYDQNFCIAQIGAWFGTRCCLILAMSYAGWWLRSALFGSSPHPHGK